jgi:hypothetical protein
MNNHAHQKEGYMLPYGDIGFEHFVVADYAQACFLYTAEQHQEVKELLERHQPLKLRYLLHFSTAEVLIEKDPHPGNFWYTLFALNEGTQIPSVDGFKLFATTNAEGLVKVVDQVFTEHYGYAQLRIINRERCEKDESIPEGLELKVYVKN